jgi:DNA-directed RNA polymerase subunit K/omega
MKKDFRFKGNRPDDIFEAITVMAKRARQINQKRNEDYPIQNMIDPESDEIFENDTDFDSFEKPASLAMIDYENGDIEFEYEKVETPEEEEKEAETEE